MTIPGRLSAASLLRSLDPPEWHLRHSCAVADIAAWLARAVRRHGHPVDARLVEAAALLHDIDKLLAADDPARRLPHGISSAAWLRAHGYGELAPVVAAHPITRLADDLGDWSSRLAVDRTGAAATPVEPEDLLAGDTAGWSLEAKIVALADKRAGQHLEPMEERFASWIRRFPSGPLGLAAGSAAGGWDGDLAVLIRVRADALEASVCAAAGIRPGDVRRLRWSRRALAEAARRTPEAGAAANAAVAGAA